MRGDEGNVRRLIKARADVDHVRQINAAFGERAGELKKPAKRVALIDLGLVNLFMM